MIFNKWILQVIGFLWFMFLPYLFYCKHRDPWSVDQNSRVWVDRTIVSCTVVPYVGTLVTEWSSLERSLAAEFRQGWDRYMVAMCSFRSWRVGQHSFWIRMCWSRKILFVVVELESSWTPVSYTIASWIGGVQCVCSWHHDLWVPPVGQSNDIPVGG